MKIATWNVNSIRTRKEQVKQWLMENKIDVICLQETKVIDGDFPVDFFTDIGYHLYIYGQKAYNGVAIFSLQPLEDIRYGFSGVLSENIVDNFDEQKRVISGVINNIRIVNLYVPNGNSLGSQKYEYKLRWLEILKQYLTTLKNEYSEELLVCGDFNIALEDKDIYKAEGKENHIMASTLERDALKEILNLGFADIFRKFTVGGDYYSWWDYRQGGFSKNRGWRIDHIYLTDKLSQKAINCYIDTNPRKLTQPSDHAPVICEF
ncbi:MAG: exodeoxyribonuclease III [Cyanobacteria bacterium]|nr:exodeoxyribonuclease III [Cyanobacteria bacterium CG_2015-16_32_12]NCO79386.1 exodeoxyribonuclease III [Cyanobacteria bacterium CG_2015-22_32_23]NCQ05476.1 exodeoxyribonuclease III [Cyanobacteria bacterium CG_2015-09_32_10]NCQ41404.1 exodeoxyribonuclease III [Cyanobacteria bacterium CG_2015-04_32_10]NCS85660.1 exodeoxyribonuclease III [Cyanobacteria bacterium CG_2015-02_32_10]